MIFGYVGLCGVCCVKYMWICEKVHKYNRAVMKIVSDVF